MADRPVRPKAKSKPRTRAGSGPGYALGATALTAAVGLATQGQWWEAAGALAVALLVGETTRRRCR